VSEVWSLLFNKVLQEGVCQRYGVNCSTRYCRRECVRGMESTVKQGTAGGSVSEVWSLLFNKVLQEGVCWRYGIYCSTRYCRRECVGGMESIVQQGTKGTIAEGCQKKLSLVDHQVTAGGTCLG